MRKSISLRIFSIALLIISPMGMVGMVAGNFAHCVDEVSDAALALARCYIPIDQTIQWAAHHATGRLAMGRPV